MIYDVIHDMKFKDGIYMVGRYVTSMMNYPKGPMPWKHQAVVVDKRGVRHSYGVQTQERDQ